MKVAKAELEKGLLSIDLLREVPEQLKPRRIPIAAAGQDNAPLRQIDLTDEAKTKAA